MLLGYPLQEHSWHSSVLLCTSQSSWHSEGVHTPPVLPPGYPEAVSEKCDPSGSWQTLHEHPSRLPSNKLCPLTSQSTARLAVSGERQILFTFSDWKRGNSNSLADRLWKEGTSCGGFLVGSVVANCSISRIRNLFKHHTQSSHLDFH